MRASSLKHFRDDGSKRRRDDRVGVDITNIASKRQDCGARKDCVQGNKDWHNEAAKENAMEERALKSAPHVVDISHKYVLPSQEPEPPPMRPEEEDPQRLSQRQKQIDYGKNTLGYERYLEQVPKHVRRKEDPWTPNRRQVCSKRSFDGQIKKWRRQLHAYDPPDEPDDVLTDVLG